MAEPTPPTRPAARSARLWRMLGTASVAVGLFNAFVPLLPTTIFLIIGVWAYGKGSPELRDKLLAHPQFGPALRNWVERRAMTRLAKWQCIGTIVVGYFITLGFVGLTRVSVGVGIGLALLCLFLATRPEPASCPVTQARRS
jgi:uncharacterized membrane protein YbaN (DUF454 family)